MPLIMLFGKDEKSILFFSGKITVFTPVSFAARSFSLMPPTGRIRPERVISPLRAISLLHFFV